MSLSVHSCPSTSHLFCSLPIYRLSNFLEDTIFMLLDCQVTSLVVDYFFTCALLRRSRLAQAFFLIQGLIWDRMIASWGKMVSVWPERRLTFSWNHLWALLTKLQLLLPFQDQHLRLLIREAAHRVSLGQLFIKVFALVSPRLVSIQGSRIIKRCFLVGLLLFTRNIGDRVRLRC